MRMQTSDVAPQEVGVVTHARQYVCRLQGLPSAKVNDILIDDDGHRALVVSLENEYLVAQMLDPLDLAPGRRFYRTDVEHFFTFGDHLSGHIVSPLGEVRDAEIEPEANAASTPFSLDVIASGISERLHIRRQNLTGIAIADILIPIGKGQRQLVFGPPKSGKRDFVAQAVQHQHEDGAVCIYASIGQSPTAIQERAAEILGNRAPNGIMVAASSEDPSPLVILTPPVAFQLAEYFTAEGRDVLLVLDDLGTHAKYLREAALLQDRLPGRESYPGDVFYQHAHLMERSGAFRNAGSLTLLPMLETDAESTTDLISTNLIGSTDGNFSFTSDRRAAGYFPAIEIEESITRVGRQTQSYMQKQLSTRVQSVLASYREQQRYSQFGAEPDEEVQQNLRQGEMLIDLLNQNVIANIPVNVQVLLLALPFTDFGDEQGKAAVEENKGAVIAALRDREAFAELRESALSDGELDGFIAEMNAHVSALRDLCPA